MMQIISLCKPTCDRETKDASTCLSWSRCSCGTWWACSPGSSRPAQWQLHAGCYHDWRWPARRRWTKSAQRSAVPLAWEVGRNPRVTFTICWFSVGVTKSPSTSLTTCLRLVACDIINEVRLLPPAGDRDMYSDYGYYDRLIGWCADQIVALLRLHNDWPKGIIKGYRSFVSWTENKRIACNLIIFTIITMTTTTKTFNTHNSDQNSCRS